MKQEKEELLTIFHQILSNNVLGDKQYDSRYKGFVGELAFQEWSKNKLESKFYSGGYFMPIEVGVRSIINPVYFTVSSEKPHEYNDIYTLLSQLPCREMYFIQWDKKIPFLEWQESADLLLNNVIKIPQFTVFKFDDITKNFIVSNFDIFLKNFAIKTKRTRSFPIPENMKKDWLIKLSNFSYELLLDLYVDRLIFDAFIGYSRSHGIPSDIDSIVYSTKQNKYSLLEIKEKDLSKRAPQGFGMDVERINDLEMLSNQTTMSIYYVVRQIDNQKNRNFLAWKSINLKNFINNLPDKTIQGGSGMGFQNAQYPTKVCPIEYFKTFE
ncbi:hypothetical protein B9T11_08805 [Wohlfahrtiimonas chitiniclastica]|uniref:hypothetical protein n=1 Tax=Wohlfahrtiimonas chitiniclastica TaxID=400946 RepID=UPI000B9881FE|nr:hypothetical protein [Wohlfahrtiimonas chitiniclastica]OYQ79325.1 hypothetical protein B9T11_08805 [Wohlfahrtiimonas chitiniclastica]